MGELTPLTYGPYYLMSADGSLVILNRSTGGPAIWGQSGLTAFSGLSFVQGISADGSVMVGYSNGVMTAWRASGSIPLQSLRTGYGYGAITAISANGRYAIGNMAWGGGGYDRRPVIWDTLTGDVTDIGDTPLGTNYGWAKAVSDDGTVVVGYNWTNTKEQVFRWENGVRFDLPDVYSQGMLLSGNGQVIVMGTSQWVGGADGTLHTNIEYVAGGVGASVNAVSYDGKTVIGTLNVPDTGYRAFRWVDGVGTTLGALPDALMYAANAMSADTSIVVGSAYLTGGYTAVRWNGEGDIYTIASLLERGGIDIDGWLLSEAQTISADGTVIVGSGSRNGSAGYWIARCDDACNILVDQDVLAQSFSALGGMGATASTYMGVETATLGDMAAQARTGAVTGFAFGAFDSDPTTSASVGATYGLGNDLALSASVGIAAIETLLPYDGAAMFSGPAASIALSSKPTTGFNWLLGGSLIGLSGTVERGYLNGNTPVTSSGDTTGHGAGFTAEAGWTFNDLIADTLVTPFVSVTLSSVSFAGYTETDGPFPATFQPFTTSSALLRLGTEFSHEFQPGSTVTAGISYAHNFGGGGTISGTAGGIGISVPGAAPITNFIEASVGLDMPITEQVNFTGRLAGILPLDGAPASIQARAGITMAF